ncbi:hypothetical protein [Nocardia sp. NPDC052566]|uniref:hypothetical protein n=1 Tax=Nocardia sp. NPDC052566 TaxID=3364330 RepID=UPI0037CB8EAB
MSTSITVAGLENRPAWWHNQTIRVTASVARGWDLHHTLLSRTQWDRELLDDHVRGRLRELCARAATHGPFRQRAAATSAAETLDLTHFPVLDKKDLVENWDALHTGLVDPVDVLRVFTSGTTGQPISIDHSDRQLDYGSACSLRVLDAYGLAPGLRCLRVTCDPRHPLLDFDVVDALGPALQLNVSKVTPENRATVHDICAQFRPDAIWGQPMELLITTSKIRDGLVPALTPKLVMTHGDNVSPRTRSVIRETFEAAHCDYYALQELGQVAWQCPVEVDTYHVNEERVLLRFLPDNILALTSLINTAMTLVNYAPQDCAVPVPEPCSCGRVLARVRQIKGRQRGFLVDSDGGHLNIKWLQTTLDGLPVAAWRVAQREAGTLHIDLAYDAHSSAAAEIDRLRAGIADRLRMSQVTIGVSTPEAVIGDSGKVRQFDLYATQETVADNLLGAS